MFKVVGFFLKHRNLLKQGLSSLVAVMDLKCNKSTGGCLANSLFPNK